MVSGRKYNEREYSVATYPHSMINMYHTDISIGGVLKYQHFPPPAEAGNAKKKSFDTSLVLIFGLLVDSRRWLFRK